ncbi:MAG: carbohydrate ABC transporter substrate-binding protein [Clostridia bacterium]|nr:carbohydrate ABC transporter substrate-binding protein [Clostridia bacterium]
MKHFAKRITALLLLLLMTASLLASCSGGGAGEAQTPEKEENQIPVFDEYKSKTVGLGLTENEMVMDVMEEDGKIRATIAVAESDFDPDRYYGIPSATEYRWYSQDYVEDTAKREKTRSDHELTAAAVPNQNVVLGGKAVKGFSFFGLQCQFCRDGKPIGDVLSHFSKDSPSADDGTTFAYGALTHAMVYEDVIYAALEEGTWSGGIVHYWNDWSGLLCIDGRMIDVQTWKPGYPTDFAFCGLIGLEGKPYALLAVDGKGLLEPLNPEMTELTFEGMEIEVVPTGGATSDGRFGYFMSNTELWRTDGKECTLLADLTPHGVTLSSGLRTVCSLADGRILVTIDGKLIELSPSDGSEEQEAIYNIGVLDYYNPWGGMDDLNLVIAKYNDQSENGYFRIKEYRDVANLNLALLSGEIAMVITPNQFVLQNQVKQGALASLEDVAPKLFEKDVLIESIVDAARIDGVFYYLPRYFDIRGELITDPSLLKDGKLFETRQEYYDFITQNDPNYFEQNTPGDIFDTFARDMDEWIDWEANTCHFDDGTFEALLEFASQGATQEEADQYESWLWNQSQFGIHWKVSSFTLSDGVENYRFTDLKKALSHQATAAEPNAQNDDPAAWAQIDFPMPSRVHDGYEIFAQNFFAVANQEESQEAAGKLLTWLILEDVEEKFPDDQVWYWIKMGFSINKDETERYLGRLRNAFVEESNGLDMMHNLKCGEKQYKATWDYIHNADHFRYADNELFDVMKKEAVNFFGGQTTAKQAAEYVQNRISLYLAEQS